MFKEFFSQVEKSAKSVSGKVKKFFKKEERTVKENWTEAVEVVNEDIKAVKKAAKKVIKKVTKTSSKKVAKKVVKKSTKKVK